MYSFPVWSYSLTEAAEFWLHWTLGQVHRHKLIPRQEGSLLYDIVQERSSMVSLTFWN